MAVKFSDFTTGATTANTFVVGYDSVAGTNDRYTLEQIGEGIFGVDFSIANFSWEYSNTRLGIGTASPAATLQIDSNDDEEGLVVNGSQDQYSASLKSDTTTGKAWGPYIRGGSNSSDAGLIVDKADGTTTYFKIRGDGNIGIGETAPDEKLEIAGNVHVQGQGYIELVDAVNATLTVDWDDGNVQELTSLTGSLTFTASNPKIGAIYILTLGQTGTVTATWTGVKWPAATAPTLSGNLKTDIITLVCYDATGAGLYYGSSVLNFTT